MTFLETIRIRSNDLFQKTVLCIIISFTIIPTLIQIQELNSKYIVQILFIPNPTPFCLPSKGQLILKGNCQAVNSLEKRTNEFVFTSIFVRFLEEIEDSKKAFRNYLTFRIIFFVKDNYFDQAILKCMK